jgi:hypothetical protein
MSHVVNRVVLSLATVSVDELSVRIREHTHPSVTLVLR